MTGVANETPETIVGKDHKRYPAHRTTELVSEPDEKEAVAVACKGQFEQKYIADQLGVPPRTVSDWFSENRDNGETAATCSCVSPACRRS